jgi:hypothetical protein
MAASPAAPSPVGGGGGDESSFALVATALRRFLRQLPPERAVNFPEKVLHQTLQGI